MSNDLNELRILRYRMKIRLSTSDEIVIQVVLDRRETITNIHFFCNSGFY